jgi:hypothetical protein
VSDTQTAPAPQNGEGWVVMYHPASDVDGDHTYTEAPKAAYDEVWEPKGWKLANTTPAAVEDDGLTHKQRLQRDAEALGLDSSGTVAELEDRLAAARGGDG